MRAFPLSSPARSAGRLGRARGSVARKAVVAVSGAILLGWSCLHLLGTLTVFAGPAVMDQYAAGLRRAGGVPLWGIRALLFAAFGVHVWLVLGLWARARRARPIAYAGSGARRVNAAARWLRCGSLLLFVAIVAHVLHLSFGFGHPHFEAGHAYSRLLGGIDSGWMVLAYVAFALIFMLHLGHGVRAGSMSLGVPLGGRSGSRTSSVLAIAVAVALGLGFALIPLAIGFGVVQ